MAWAEIFSRPSGVRIDAFVAKDVLISCWCRREADENGCRIGPAGQTFGG